ncbi:barstar family protein [Photobacterium swingsii]|uniref:barstar family protein n=2 Tax=Photobacterium swingsii TaxID=680026 RepID=UPI003D09E455
MAGVMLQSRLVDPMQVIIDFNEIESWKSFHFVFSEIMGFPDFYGENMDAWIDCMSNIDDPEAGMSAIVVKSNENLDMIVLGMSNALKNTPEIFQCFFECTVAVNQRFIETDSETRLKIVGI